MENELKKLEEINKDLHAKVNEGNMKLEMLSALLAKNIDGLKTSANYCIISMIFGIVGLLANSMLIGMTFYTGESYFALALMTVYFLVATICIYYVNDSVKLFAKRMAMLKQRYDEKKKLEALLALNENIMVIIDKVKTHENK